MWCCRLIILLNNNTLALSWIMTDKTPCQMHAVGQVHHGVLLGILPDWIPAVNVATSLNEICEGVCVSPWYFEPSRTIASAAANLEILKSKHLYIQRWWYGRHKAIHLRHPRSLNILELLEPGSPFVGLSAGMVMWMPQHATVLNLPRVRILAYHKAPPGGRLYFCKTQNSLEARLWVWSSMTARWPCSLYKHQDNSCSTIWNFLKSIGSTMCVPI